jgi:hypothetical protein
MIIIREHVHIGPHVVHHNREPLKQGIDGLTGEMSEVLVLSPISRIHPSLNLSISNMSFFQHRTNSKSQVLRVHPIEFRLTQSTKQVVVTPQVFGRVINPNDLVNRVDFGQTTINLGHHLENITDNP